MNHTRKRETSRILILKRLETESRETEKQRELSKSDNIERKREDEREREKALSLRKESKKGDKSNRFFIPCRLVEYSRQHKIVDGNFN